MHQPRAGGADSRRAGQSRLADLIGGQLDSLSEWASLPAEMRECLGRAFGLLTRESLDRPIQPPYAGLSNINADGLPFQWVFRFDRDGSAFGFLCEVGMSGETARQRLTQSLERLELVCDAVGLNRPQWLPEVVALLVPGGHLLRGWRSAMWIGVAASSAGLQIKPYFNLNRDSARERWLRAGWILKSLGRERSLERLCELSGQVSTGSWPVGVAFDIRPNGSAGRVKIYFRSEAIHAVWLERWYRAVGYERDFGTVRRCLDLFAWTGKQPYPEGAFTVSIEFHPDDRLSVKTDLGVTKWISCDERIAAGTLGLIDAVGGKPDDLKRAFAALGACPANTASTSVLRFVGLGSEPDGLCHVNVYTEPSLTAKARGIAAPPQRSTSDAIGRGLCFVMSMRRDAHWRDFNLPTGESHAWVTAYILARLGELPRTYISETTQREVEESLDWLLASRTREGGWGYNETVEDDADSTSWAILALRRFGRQVPAPALRLLRRCERPGGSFATFPEGRSPGKGWEVSVPDVTAVAVKALERRPGVENLFSRWLRADGTLPAYWWPSPLYTCAEVVGWAGRDIACRVVARIGEGIVRYAAQNAFEEALLLRCLVGLKMEAAELTASRLCFAQRTDGSWASAALLRLTAPEVIEPWNAIDAGPLYLDLNGLFTAATALYALGRYVSIIS